MLQKAINMWILQQSQDSLTFINGKQWDVVGSDSSGKL